MDIWENRGNIQSRDRNIMNKEIHSNKNDKFTCANCEETFDRETSYEDAVAEKEELFGDIPLDMCDEVCDPCFKKIMDFNEPGLKRYEKFK